MPALPARKVERAIPVPGGIAVLLLFWPAEDDSEIGVRSGLRTLLLLIRINVFVFPEMAIGIQVNARLRLGIRSTRD